MRTPLFTVREECPVCGAPATARIGLDADTALRIPEHEYLHSFTAGCDHWPADDDDLLEQLLDGHHVHDRY